MRILFANVIEQNAGWGVEYFLSPALQRLGHSVHNVDFRKNRYSLTR